MTPSPSATVSRRASPGARRRVRARAWSPTAARSCASPMARSSSAGTCRRSCAPSRPSLHGDGEILAAVAAEEEAMVDLLGELVAAPTVLGHEESGQAVMRRAFAELGLD